LSEEPRGQDRYLLPLPLLIAGVLMLAYFLGWFVGLGTGADQQEAMLNPFSLLYRLSIAVLWPLVVCLVIFLASASAGVVLLKLIRSEARSPVSRLLFSTAIGLGVTAYATLGLGTLGLLQPRLLWAMMGVLIGAGAWPLSRVLRETWLKWCAWSASWDAFEWALALAGGAVLLLGVLCARTPILDYDTLSYHLGAPGEYYAMGRVTYLPHNVYASFPEHVEMLYLLGITLSGSKSDGMAVAILVQAMFGALAALAVGLLASRFVRQEAGLPAAVFFLLCPLFVVTVLRGHITLARCLYKSLALLAAIEWVFGVTYSEHRRAWLVLGGLCAGLAVAVKYTALLTLCLPIGLVVLAVALLKEEKLLGKLGAPALLAACALVAALPWFVKNFAATGNPVFPLLHSVFGAQGWPAAQAAKFAEAHAVPSFAPGEVLVDTWQFLTGHVEAMAPAFAGVLAVLFIPLLLVPLLVPERGEKPTAKAHAGPLVVLACYCVVFVLLWGLTTHRISRFLAPALVALSVLSAAGFVLGARTAVVRRACRVAALLGAAFLLCVQLSLALMNGGLGGSLLGEQLADLAPEMGNRSYAQAVEVINAERLVPPGSSVMMIGENRIYYFDRPLVYASAFNEHPVEPALALAREGDMARAVAALRATGVSHVLVNWSEVRRLAVSYEFTYEGQKQPGYLPQMDLGTQEPLLSLLQAAGRPVARFGGTGWPQRNFPRKVPVIEIYDVRPVPGP